MIEAPWTKEFKHCQLLSDIEHFLRHKVILQNLALLLFIKSVILELARLDTWGRAMRVCVCMRAQAHSLCPTLCDPMDCSLPGSSVHVIFQARVLEWVAIFSSRGSSWPRDRTCVFCIVRQILYHWATCEVYLEWLSLHNNRPQHTPLPPSLLE